MTVCSFSLTCAPLLCSQDGLVKVRSEPQALSKEFEAMKKEMV